MQKTFIIFKPDCMEKRLVGTVLSRFEAAFDPSTEPQAPTRAAAALLPHQRMPEKESQLLSMFWKDARIPPALARKSAILPGVQARSSAEGTLTTQDSPHTAPPPVESPPVEPPPERGTVAASPVLPLPRPSDLAQMWPRSPPEDDPTFQLRPSSSRIGDARDLLLLELSRAASQGLVEVAQPVRPLLPSEPPPPPRLHNPCPVPNRRRKPTTM